MTIRLILIPLLISLGGCELLSDIDRSLYQVTDSMTQKDRLTGQRVASSSRGSQIQTGNQAIAKIKAQLDAKGIAYNAAYNPAAYHRLNRIFQRIHSVSHLQHEQWQLLLLPNKEFNAFVTGGTYVVVYSGLEKKLQDDAEVAAVIGHEFAHVVANHIGERQSHQQLALLSGSKSAGRSSFNAAFTHENEEEADKLGILYSALAGYDPYAAYRVWHRQYQQRGDRGSLYVDHPVYSERSALARDTANKVKHYFSPGVKNPNHANILKNNPLFQYRASGFSKGGDGGGLATFVTALAESQKTHQAAKAEEKRQTARIQLLRNVNQLLKVTNLQQLSNDSWVFTLKYQGNRALGSLAFTGALAQNGKTLATLRAKVQEVFRPGGRYQVVARTDQSLPLGVRVTGYRFDASEVTLR